MQFGIENRSARDSLKKIAQIAKRNCFENI